MHNWGTVKPVYTCCLRTNDEILLNPGLLLDLKL